jgi:hypothetical protein
MRELNSREKIPATFEEAAGMKAMRAKMKVA